ncbi:probable cardiolipin synthase (CMP-forming) [Neocloeon triangulifer]|uniref:probable cardiolipin synthase (CMP-forming) n=1 Tax=Neocloeon triangulifer TaxID=2078957 RepID=UPI00286EE911|nr:probable cardiolipin synthase (CMP-forming) [Neocloeon triangulifer]
MTCYAPMSRSLLRLDKYFHLNKKFVERLLLGPKSSARHAFLLCNQASLIASRRLHSVQLLASAHHDLLERRSLFDPEPLARQRRLYSSNESDKKGLHMGRVHKDNLIKDVIQMKKDQFLEREKRLRATGQNILNDIRETKDKMRERMEVVIERENIWTIPNILCVSRIVASPYLGYLIIQGDFPFALGIFTVAGITDMLDGWIARNFNQSSKLGSFLDPLADKIMISVLFATLSYAGHIPLALTVLIIGRDALLVLAGFVIRYKSLPPPRTLSRYFDASLVTAQLQPTLVSKINTVVQLMFVASVLVAPVISYPSQDALTTFGYITAATTIASALSYIIERNTFKIISKR